MQCSAVQCRLHDWCHEAKYLAKLNVRILQRDYNSDVRCKGAVLYCTVLYCVAKESQIHFEYDRIE